MDELPAGAKGTVKKRCVVSCGCPHAEGLLSWLYIGCVRVPGASLPCLLQAKIDLLCVDMGEKMVTAWAVESWVPRCAKRSLCLREDNPGVFWSDVLPHSHRFHARRGHGFIAQL